MASPIALGTYNPSQVPKGTLLSEFTARRSMLSDLLGILRSNAPGEPCQHSLLIGPRGFGKTTSLFALKYGVEDDDKLAATWEPLLFDEENYQIADLAGFWLECLRLAETAFRISLEAARYALLSISRDPNLESMAREAFLSVLDQNHRRCLLLIDNINDILSVVSDEIQQHRLRAFLLEDSRVCVVGTATTYFEAIQNTDQPFYNLFRVFRLDRFSPEEMRAAVEGMAKARSTGAGALSLPTAEGYWKGLHILTGGNPRLLKMVFQLMEQGVTSDFRAQLEGLLDAYTPYFKHRIEAMSPQQRRVFDAIALAWDPVQISDIAPSLRMESNQISAQVRSLMDAQLIGIAGGSAKRRTYQIADRFSNIYYFMRYSRAGRSRFEWFILTMKAILTPEQFRLQLDRMRTLGLACADDSELRDQAHLLVSATHALDDPGLRRAEAHKSVAVFLTHSQENALNHLLDDPEMREDLAEEHAAVRFFAELPRMERESINYRPDDARWWYRLTDFAEARLLWPLAEAAYRKAIEIDPLDASPWNGLGNLLADHLRRFEEAEAAYRKAIEIDPLDASPWNGLGNLLADHLRRSEEAESAYRRAIEIDPSNAYPWNNLGNLLKNHLRRFEEAEAAYRKAIEIDPSYASPWNGLGNLLADHLGRFEEAEAAYRKAIEIDPSYAYSWYALGTVLADHRRFEEAEAAYRKAIEIDPSDAYSWYALGTLLADHRRFEEAEAAYRRAIEIDPSDAYSWYALGTVLADHRRFEEAEAAYRKAIEIDPSYAYPWNGLGNLLADHRRFEEAEAAYRKAIEIDPSDAYPWNGLGNILKNHFRRFEEAEAAYRRAVEIDPSDAVPLNGLGNLLADHRRFEEAEVAYRKAIEIDASRAFPKAGLADLLFKRGNRAPEAIELCTEALLIDPEAGWPRQVFRQVALTVPDSAARVLKRTAEALANAHSGADPGDPAGQLYSLALDCISTLLRANQDDKVLALIDRPETRDLFEIPIRAIEIRRDPAAKAQLATESVALAEVFLEKVAGSPASASNK
jgi:tetratricopeptide (TPR) repeat protein